MHKHVAIRHFSDCVKPFTVIQDNMLGSIQRHRSRDGRNHGWRRVHPAGPVHVYGWLGCSDYSSRQGIRTYSQSTRMVIVADKKDWPLASTYTKKESILGRTNSGFRDGGYIILIGKPNNKVKSQSTAHHQHHPIPKLLHAQLIVLGHSTWMGNSWGQQKAFYNVSNKIDPWLVPTYAETTGM